MATKTTVRRTLSLSKKLMEIIAAVEENNKLKTTTKTTIAKTFNLNPGENECGWLRTMISRRHLLL